MRGPPPPLAEAVRRRRAKQSLIAMGLLFATFIAFSSFYDPYREYPERRIASEAFDSPDVEALVADGGWKLTKPRISWASDQGFEGSGGMRLIARNGRGAWLERAIEDPRQYEALRVRARLRLVDYEPRAEGYSGARWVLFFRDEAGEAMWNHPHAVCVETEAAGGDWIDCQGTFDIPETAASGHVRAQIVAERGTLLVDDLEVLPATSKSSRFLWMGLLIVFWVLGVGCALAWLSPWRDSLGIAQLALAALIVFGTVCPTWVLQDTVAIVRDAGARMEQTWSAQDPDISATGRPEADATPPSSAPASPGSSSDTQPSPSAAARNAGDREASATAPGDSRPDRSPRVEPEPEGSSGKREVDGESHRDAPQPSGPAVDDSEPGRVARFLGRVGGRIHAMLSGADMVATAKRSGHASLFFVLAAVTFAGLWWRGKAGAPSAWAQNLLVLLMFAAATEMLQAVVPSRGPAMNDWWLDAAGISAALLASLALYLSFALVRRVIKAAQHARMG